MFNVSVVFSIVLSAIIGWQVSQKVFLVGLSGSASKLSKEKISSSAVMNLITTIWNCFMIIYIWIELGFFTLTAILYVLLIIVAFLIGLNHKQVSMLMKNKGGDDDEEVSDSK